ncbi:MAG TPA: bifunctional 4-hydroxy-2-oxoglutarate aldolase/2-dehydro-3-deoxy-phosphogluconate aldolase [Bryobacteraceae bacterium]|nr:bifunctional 4-hydroxy-2-oxoglutarate aldolase/2-dehydro-3-deoxy-phosphogluconate aldolase [Bryobacteraceae bacterium]
MNAKEILTFITDAGIVPVVRTSSAEGAIKAVEALYNGGVRAAEITMTVPGAIRALEKVADQFGDKIMLGAGTVLDPETARACMLAGAEFFVTPSLRLSTIELIKRYSKVVCPGALTPTEVLTAWEAGADVVKIFPCGNVGGPKYIKALKGPFPQIEMIPTGGVNLETAGEFLKAGACAVAVGGELVDGRSVKEGRFDVIENRARLYLAAIAKARSEM